MVENPQATGGAGPAGIAAVALGAIFWVTALALPSFYDGPQGDIAPASGKTMTFGMATMIPAYLASLGGVICAFRELAIRGKRAVAGYVGLFLCLTPTMALVAWLLKLAGPSAG